MISKKYAAKTISGANQELLKITEVAARWQTSYWQARWRLIEQGVPVIALGPGTLRVRLAEILKLEKCRHA